MLIVNFLFKVSKKLKKKLNEMKLKGVFLKIINKT